MTTREEQFQIAMKAYKDAYESTLHTVDPLINRQAILTLLHFDTYAATQKVGSVKLAEFDEKVRKDCDRALTEVIEHGVDN